MEDGKRGGWVDELDSCTVHDGREAKGRVIKVCVGNKQELLE